MGIPLVNGNGLRDSIVRLLAGSPDLNLKQISKEVPGYTYQGVHKTLSELLDEDVVVKTEKAYRLSPEWIAGLNKFSRDTTAKYSSDAFVDFTVWTFDSLSAADDGLVQLAMMLPKTGKREVLCIRWAHLWIPLFMDKETYAAMREHISASETYSVTSSDTVVDRWCATFWRKVANVKAGVPPMSPDNIVVYGDVVAQLFYPKSILRELDRAYDSCTSIKELDVDALFNKVFQKKVEIPVLIFRDAKIAEQLKQETIALFKKG